MSANKLKFTLGIIATTGVVALSAVANAESTKSSVVSNILNRANLSIALSQTAPVDSPKQVNPNAGKKVSPPINSGNAKVSPSLANTPGQTIAPGQAGVWRLKPGGKKGEIEFCGILCNDACNGSCGKGILPQ